MVAHGCMNGTVACNPLVKSRAYQRQHAALAAASDTKVLAIPFRQRSNIVDGSYGTGEDTLIWHFVAVVEVGFPISVERTVVQTVINHLVHGHGNPVNTYLKGDDTLRRCPHVAAVRTATGSRHTQQCGIFARFYRHAENAVYLASPGIVVVIYLINVYVLGASLRK